MIRKKDRITLEKLKELAVTHGKRIFIVYGPAEEEIGEDPPEVGDVSWECVFKPPKRQDWLSFKRDTTSTHADIKNQAPEGYAKSCVVYVAGSPPGIEPILAFDALLKDYPAAADSAAVDLTRSAGFDAAHAEK